MNAKSFLIILGILVTILALVYFIRPFHWSPEEWPEYLGGPDRNHYSTLKQIDPSNVSQLQKVWEYHTQDSGQVQCNPIIVDGRLFAVTANAEPFALDAATGKELWRVRNNNKNNVIMRGVSYWQDGDDKRILFTRDSWLHAEPVGA